MLADPLVLCNGYLEKQDNGRLLADLLGTDRGTVAFDEYHHGLTFSDLSPQAWLLTPWGAGMMWLLVAVFVGLLLARPRLRTAHSTAGRSRAGLTPNGRWRWASCCAGPERAPSRSACSRRRASERWPRAPGLPLKPRERFWNALWVRAPELAGDLAEAESALHSSAGGDSDLLKAAQRLHDVAYPISPERNRLRPTASKEVK